MTAWVCGTGVADTVAGAVVVGKVVEVGAMVHMYLVEIVEVETEVEVAEVVEELGEAVVVAGTAGNYGNNFIVDSYSPQGILLLHFFVFFLFHLASPQPEILYACTVFPT